MTYVITDKCAEAKDMSCVAVCPVDCIHPTPGEAGFAEATQLYVDPEACIDCRACEEVCPVDAIVSQDDLSEEDAHFLEVNAAFFRGK